MIVIGFAAGLLYLVNLALQELPLVVAVDYAFLQLIPCVFFHLRFLLSQLLQRLILLGGQLLGLCLQFFARLLAGVVKVLLRLLQCSGVEFLLFALLAGELLYLCVCLGI